MKSAESPQGVKRRARKFFKDWEREAKRLGDEKSAHAASAFMQALESIPCTGANMKKNKE